MKSWVVLLISIALTSIGQLILKKGLLVFGPLERVGGRFFQMLYSPLVLLGIVFAVLGWAAYVFALSKTELSYAYPVWSLTYIVVPLLSLLIFREGISLLKMSGLGVMAVGIILVAISVK